MANGKKLEESDGIKELDLLKEWADKCIVYPLAFSLREEVNNAYKLIKNYLEDLKKYKKPKIKRI